jgi:hypothetical protein
MSDGSMLTGAIAKISTQTAGGWRIALDVPEIMGEVVRQLLGSENKIVYNISFDAISEIDQPEKRQPGRPKNKSAE